MNKLTIDDEADFIHKVRNKYLFKRNHDAAIKIQSLARRFLVRCWYCRLYEKHVGAAIMLQKNMRMKLLRRKFLGYIDDSRY